MYFDVKFVIANIIPRLLNKVILEIIEQQSIIGNASTHNCIVNANRSSTDPSSTQSR